MISQMVSQIIGRPAELYVTDINGLVVKVTDWEYIFSGILMVGAFVAVFSALVIIVRVMGGMFK